MKCESMLACYLVVENCPVTPSQIDIVEMTISPGGGFGPLRLAVTVDSPIPTGRFRVPSDEVASVGFFPNGVNLEMVRW
jgi:hypothetical protein